MKKIVKLGIGTACITGLVGASGCVSTNVDAQFRDAVQAYHNDISTEYLNYVAADANLDEDAKQVRFIRVDQFGQLLLELEGAE